MNAFEYQNGLMHAEGVSVAAIAEAVGTPFYLYSSAALAGGFLAFQDAFSDVDSLVCYAMKANSNQAVLKTLGPLGAGIDVVSEGELRRALAAGIPADRIVFSGVGKTAPEMDFALDAGIYCFNVESEAELEALNERAIGKGKRAPVSLRVNPDVDARTHAKISTGKKENKFGLAFTRVREIYARAALLPGLEIAGIDMHIGSQITDLEPFANAFDLLRELIETLRSDGHQIGHIDIGGGLGIPYSDSDQRPPDPAAYAKVVKDRLSGLGCKIILEPGRSIAGNAGVLITKVIYLKHEGDRHFVIVDAGMNDLIRPTLYDAHHDISPVCQSVPGAASIRVDVVGPVCETGDFLALGRRMPLVEAGDLLAVGSAGAYGAVQACEYNSRPLIAEVLVKGDAFHVIRPRRSFEEMIAADSLPAWLTEER
ncbi:diaminopimelate decarboxylase (plasmid) [Agrobacterium leguminum]|uniref:diaminopimelate decarboxylase n=1 Tax=Agrobacterium TaxID=357 RepID=UPI0009BBDB09|nr:MULTISPECIES: diaminopimelate decarboxylase [Agrobacterium]WFS70113.1 diaminopimelate decarboxylase [Agrobacterium leguminum]